MLEVSGQNPLERLALKEDYFTLKHEFERLEQTLSEPEKLVYTAILEGALNKPVDSNEKISKIKREHFASISDSLKLKLLRIEIENCVRLYAYKEALQLSNTLLATFPDMDSLTEAEIINENKLWQSMSPFPQQTVSEIDKESKITLSKDRAGLYTIEIRTPSGTSDFILDSGANFSVVRESIAKKYNWKIYSSEALIGTASGSKVKTKVAVAESLWMGDILFRNVIFLVMEDRDLTFKLMPLLKYEIRGILGMPVIRALKKIELHSEGYLLVCDPKESSAPTNLMFNGFTPIVQISVGNDSWGFQIDTGARASSLSGSNLHELVEENQSRIHQRRTTSAGAGGTNVVNNEALSDFEFKLLDKEVKLPAIKITKTPFRKSIYGNLGLDIIKDPFTSLTINFIDMNVRLQ